MQLNSLIKFLNKMELCNNSKITCNNMEITTILNRWMWTKEILEINNRSKFPKIRQNKMKWNRPEIWMFKKVKINQTNFNKIFKWYLKILKMFNINNKDNNKYVWCLNNNNKHINHNTSWYHSKRCNKTHSNTQIIDFYVLILISFT